MSKAVEITVSLKKSNSNPPKLKLKDSEGNSRDDDKLTSGVDPSATVTWIPDLASGISELTSIKKDKSVTKNNYDLLKGNGEPQTNGNIVGTIVEISPGKGKTEKYIIGFKIDGDVTTYSADPKLIMKS